MTLFIQCQNAHTQVKVLALRYLFASCRGSSGQTPVAIYVQGLNLQREGLPADDGTRRPAWLVREGEAPVCGRPRDDMDSQLHLYLDAALGCKAEEVRALLSHLLWSLHPSRALSAHAGAITLRCHASTCLASSFVPAMTFQFASSPFSHHGHRL